MAIFKVVSHPGLRHKYSPRGYRLETGTAAALRLALTITLTLTDTGFAVLTILLGYTRRSPDPNVRTQEALSWPYC